MPDAYGDSTTTQPWEQVSDRLTDAKQYWLATNHGSASAASGNVRGVYSEQIGQQSSRATFPRMAEPREFEGSFETRLSKPPEEVYAFLVDLPQTPRWRFHLGSVSWIDDGETCVGRRFSVQLSFGPWRKMALQGEVTVYEPPMRFSYRITDGPLKAENEYVVTPDGDGRRVLYDDREGGHARHPHAGRKPAHHPCVRPNDTPGASPPQ